MALDLIAISILARAGGYFLGLATAFLLLRMAFKVSGRAFGRSAQRAVLGCSGIAVLLVTAAAAWTSLTGGVSELLQSEAVSGDRETILGELGATVGEVMALRAADSEEEAREAAAQFAERLRREGSSESEVAEVVLAVLGTSESPWAGAIADSVAAAGNGGRVTRAVGADSLLSAYAAAVAAADTLRAAEIKASLGPVLASEDIRQLEGRIDQLESEKANLAVELDEAEERGLISWILGLADEIGIGVGWSGIYFTFFTYLLKGFTPGKRLLRIRVVRLDGKPIGLWIAFNRFGGYAASVFTGLLGFFEMFWDPNRQALQDRIAATVVVRT